MSSSGPFGVAVMTLYKELACAWAGGLQRAFSVHEAPDVFMFAMNEIGRMAFARREMYEIVLDTTL